MANSFQYLFDFFKPSCLFTKMTHGDECRIVIVHVWLITHQKIRLDEKEMA